MYARHRINIVHELGLFLGSQMLYFMLLDFRACLKLICASICTQLFGQFDDKKELVYVGI